MLLLEHGGKIIQAVQRYNIPQEKWLDLSTGLNPHPWPVKSIPDQAWSRLPDDDDGLLEAARDYYGGQHLLPVAGSQAAIQALPKLRSATSRIAILDPAYAEHRHAWVSSGFNVTPISANTMNHAVQNFDVVLLVNPNNPTGESFSRDQCLHWHRQLQQRNGWLVVDEAFIDCTPEHSLVADSHLPGLIVLRSLGKFFGLAGARVGFVFAEPPILHQLKEHLGPWPISGASRHVATKALQDRQWQSSTRHLLNQNGQRLYALLSQYGLKPNGGTALFQWLKNPDARHIHHQLASRAILVRLFQSPSSLRFGLPGTEAQWLQLEQELAALASLLTEYTETCL